YSAHTFLSGKVLALYQRQVRTQDARCDAIARLGGPEAFLRYLAVERGALTHRASGRLHQSTDVTDGLVRALGRTRHSTDGLLHQGASHVVDTARQQQPTRVLGEFDPGALDVVHRPVQKQPGQS